MTTAEPNDLRVLVLAPTGRDADVTREILSNDGIACTVIADAADLARQITSEAGAIVVAEEALGAGRLEHLATAVEGQESWSDVPVLVATSEAGSRAARERVRRRMSRAGGVTILERPIPIVTFLTAVRAALTARRRQYQARDLMAELRAKVAELRSERELRARFVSVLAHDLRGPLQATQIAAELVAGHDLPPERRRQLAERMTRSFEQMDHMLRDLLDIQRVQAGGGLPLKLEPCDLEEVAREAADELNAAQDARFIVRSAGRIEGIWSPDQLRRALWNLGTNAIKYGAKDAPIEIDVGRARACAYVSVHNAGPAIPAEEQAALFEPFGRSADAASGNEHGWGLGLSVVRASAEAHGGTAEVRSLPGSGTTFTIRLPFDARPFQPPGGPSSSEARPEE